MQLSLKRGKNGERNEDLSCGMMVKEDEDGMRSPQGFVIQLDAKAGLLLAGFKSDWTGSGQSLQT